MNCHVVSLISRLIPSKEFKLITGMFSDTNKFNVMSSLLQYAFGQ